MSVGARTVTVSYFSDVLCIWAYAAQLKLDQLRRQFGGQVRVEYRFLSVFGDVPGRLRATWDGRGGAAAYGRHVRETAARFDHIEVHPDIWTRAVPPSSASCHLFLKAVQALEEAGEISAAPHSEWQGRTVFEETLWRCRLAFFRDLANIAQRSVQEAIAAGLNLPVAAIWAQIDSGTAYAALCADFAARTEHLLEGSPTFMLQEGRQKLYGDVAYPIIEANVQELLRESGARASRCGV
ncbi:MAG TPA: disulfide bond formation protein DsbA [Gammaproteobacteria bacterium]|nr:disulfide bond formation protein DsbA [Gammaproteobacteria bacterium]